MATTTNYGWTTPDDTALVKDGAAAIRTLGSSVDTTTKALNPSTTLGDIEYRSSTANTNTRLGIGSSGNILTVSGGVPTWAAPAGGGGMTLLSTTNLSGTSTTVSSIDQTYNDLYILIEGATWDTDNRTPRLTFNTNPLTTSTITASGITTFTSQTGIDVNNQAQDWLRTGGKNVITLTVFAYASSQYKTFLLSSMYDGSSTVNQITNVLGGFDSTALSSITFATAASRNLTGGTIKVYGVK
jgi:hypothetical protein